MKVIRHFVKQWFNQELSEWDGWKSYQAYVQEYACKKDKSMRFLLYKKHLDIIKSYWGVQYSRTLEFAYVTDLVSADRNKSKSNELEEVLKSKYLASKNELKIAS